MIQPNNDSNISSGPSSVNLERRQAFISLYRRYGQYVKYHLAVLLAWIPDREGVIDELCQDIFFAAWINFPKINEESSFKSWLWTTTRNKAIDYIRHQKKLKFVQLPEDEEEEGEDQPYTGPPLQAPEGAAEEQACKKESSDELLTLIKQILDQMRNKRARICATLYFIGEYSEPEIAEALQINKKRVSEYVCQGRALLRSGLSYFKS